MFGPMMGAGRDYQRTDEEAARQRQDALDKRYAKLSPALKALNAIAGVESAQSDDFDSVGFNVFVYLAGNKFKLAQRLQDTKRRVRKALRSLDIHFEFGDQPHKVYSNCGFTGEKPTDQGYNTMTLDLVIYV